MYNAFNVYRREMAPGTVSLTGDRAQGDDSKHWAHSNNDYSCYIISEKSFTYIVFLLCTVNSEIFARFLISRIALKDIFATFKNRDFGMIYLHQ